MAPGAELHCYIALNNETSYLNAINQAITDEMDCILINWGAPENKWDPTIITNFNAAFQRANDAKITVVAAVGDTSMNGKPGNSINFPSSSPFVLSCGGTSLKMATPSNEVVWNDGKLATNGGVSAITSIPSYQLGVNVPGGKYRGVPDVAGNSDPATGWIIMIGGQFRPVGGTSAAAAMWSALIVCLSEILKNNVGFINPALYSLEGWSRDVLSGNNGTYAARAGYDCCTGLGVPVGVKLLSLLTPHP